ncbi:MAG: hypothetical protein JSS02_34150 [Planctomycetes bacterium]|nr:hypothetical protein [Planctomycetota bacterium]
MKHLSHGRYQKVTIYVDRISQQWIVRDSEGSFWTVPATTNAWEQRQPFSPSQGVELEPVPGHYRYLLGLPS